MSVAASQATSDARKVGAPRDQTALNLAASAEGARPGVAGIGMAALAAAPVAKLDAIKSVASLKSTPICHTCKVQLRVAVFFDGTGNNLDADVRTNEHSNVARLFRSHLADSPGDGIYRLYVPGLGTYFKDVGDPGEEWGAAFGKMGEPRLAWAMDRIDQIVARYSPANVTGLDISLFGFSRGATLARAFARRVQDRCTAQGTKWHWDRGGFEARLTFMGLFDTVASVLLPASSSIDSVRIAQKSVSLDQGLKNRRHSGSNGLEPYSDRINLGIAFGLRPGADPTPGFIDGHGAWASNLRIPEMALQCVHYVSGHEVRNSFPLDSARDRNQYPVTVDERCYPGVHSDVGGGYRPGEGGRSTGRDLMLSLPALLAMHDMALKAGVPLAPKSDPVSDGDFEIGSALTQRFNTYVQLAESLSTDKTLEGRVLANMRLYYAWRFKRIRAIQGKAQPDAAIIEREEQRYATERAALDGEIARATAAPDRLAAEQRLKKAEATQQAARNQAMARGRSDWGSMSNTQTSLEQLRKAEEELKAAKEAYAEADDPRMKLEARKATLGGSGLVSNLDAYDRNLLLDVKAIQAVEKQYPNARLRPHYTNLINAYNDEYVKGKGLLDDHPEVLAFFDNYVHDSLAGFAKDATLPSDPRVIYIGGDREAEYAMNTAETSATV